MNRLACMGIAAVAGLAIVGGAGAHANPRPPESGAGRFMVSVVRQKMQGRYDLVWQSLYPAHQRVASREAYVACESLIPSPGRLAGVRTLRVFRERIDVAGQTRPVLSNAVIVRVRVRSPLLPVTIRIVQTFHAIRVGGRWTWILSPEQYEYYSTGACPYA